MPGLSGDAENSASKGMEIERVIRIISREFHKLHEKTIDQVIHSVLSAIGTFSGADRVSVFSYDQDDGITHHTYEWCAEKISPLIDEFSSFHVKNEFPFANEQFKNSGVFAYSDISKLPPEAHRELTRLQLFEIKSILLVPMVANEQFVGLIGMNSSSQKQPWAEREQTILQLIGEMVCHALEREQLENNRKAHIHLLECLEKVDRSIRGGTDGDQVMGKVMETVIAIYNCDRAWLLYPSDPSAENWSIPIERSKPEYPGPNSLNSSHSISIISAKTLHKLLQTNEPLFGTPKPGEADNDPDDMFGIRSYMKIAIQPKTGHPWIFGLHQCSFARLWTRDEQYLFKQISRRIGDALSILLILRDLQESERKFRLAMEASRDGLWDWNVDTNKVYFSPRWANILGEEKVPHNFSAWEDRIHPDEKEQALASVREHLKGFTQNWRLEHRLKLPDGSWRWILGRGQVIERDAAGQALRMIGTITDITQRKQAEEKEKQLQDQLAQAHKMESIGNLAGGIAHEFNNILSIILGNNDLTLAELPEWSPSVKNSKEIRIAGLRARDLVSQLLTFSKKDDSKLSPINICSVTNNSIKLLRSSIPSNIDVQINLAENIGVIWGNESQINQLIINLCSNALDAVPGEGGHIGIELNQVTLSPDDPLVGIKLSPSQYLKLVVRDNGPGIKPEIIDRIFDPFFTTKKVGEGAGIGLSVVHGIVENHGAHISVESAPNKGSIFTILFPPYEMSEKEVNYDPVTLPGGDENILFVDDEPSLANLGQRHLESLGYTVNAVTEPLTALNLFQQGSSLFDLVITDMSMPGMTGHMFYQKVAEINPDIPVILCSGHSGQENIEKANKTGFKAFISKPVEKSDLARTVRRVLDNNVKLEGKGHLLLIEDDLQLRKLFATKLSGHGYEVTEARNGREGLKLFLQIQPDLVITDLIMPEKEGIETIIEIKRTSPDAIIIAISGGGRDKPDDYLNVAEALGAQKTFTKPVHWPRLLKAIRELLS